MKDRCLCQPLMHYAPIITLTSQLIFFMICSSLWFTLLSIKPSTNIRPSNNIDFDTSTRRLSFSGSKSQIFGHCISFIRVWFLSSYGFVCIGKLQGSVGFEGILIEWSLFFFRIFLVLKFMGLFSRFDICGWYDFSLFMWSSGFVFGFSKSIRKWKKSLIEKLIF